MVRESGSEKRCLSRDLNTVREQGGHLGEGHPSRGDETEQDPVGLLDMEAFQIAAETRKEQLRRNSAVNPQGNQS